MLRLASYNIHIGIGRDGAFNPGRIAAVLRETGADLIALQEVPLGPRPFDLLAQLAAATGLHAVAGPSLTDPVNGAYGNGLLSRHPVISHRRLDLSVPRRQPRCAIDALLQCPGGLGRFTLRVLATHLGLRPAERRSQVLRLLAAIEQADRERTTPTVLLGDINEWFLWGRPLRWLHAYFGRPRALASFPAGRPLFALDRIWAHPASLLVNLRVHRSALARQASDHLPLLADLVLPVSGAGVVAA